MVSSIVQPPVHVVTYAIYVQQSMYKYGWEVYAKWRISSYLLLAAMNYFPFAV